MKISVVIPLYNKAQHIGRALDSVLAQSRGADEVVVVDDGSTDGGPEVVRQYPSVRLIQQENAGVSAARNAGIAASEGDVVAFLDADDRWRKGFLAAIEALANRHPQAGLLCAGYARVGNGREPEDFVLLGAPVGSDQILGSFYRAWSKRSFTCASSVAVRRSALVKLSGLFPVGERLGEDQDMWFRLAEAAPVAVYAGALSEYDTGASGTGHAPIVDLLPAYSRLGLRIQRGEVPTRERNGACRLYASHLINVARARAATGDKAGARALLWSRAALFNPAYWARSVLSIR